MSSRGLHKRQRSHSGSSGGGSDYEMSYRKGDNMRLSGSNNSGSKKVYVSNITFDCTYQDLKEHFCSAGEVTFVQMIKDDSKRFKGCSVITYKESHMATKAIDSLNRSEFKNRKLVVKEEDANPELRQVKKKLYSDFEVVPRKLPALQSSDLNTYGLSMTFLNTLKIELPLVTRVFVANLGYNVNDKMMKEVFCLAGNIKEHEVFKDKEGNSRGFGIVEYEHPVEAVQAISMLHNQTFHDRVLAVRMDRSEKKREIKQRLPMGLRSVGMGLGLDGNALRDVKCVPSLPTPTTLAPLGSIPPLASIGGGGLIGGHVNPPLGGGLMEPFSNRVHPYATPRIGGSLSSRGFDSTPPTYSNSGGGGGSGGGGSSLGLGLGNIIQLTNLPMDYTSENLRKLCWSYGDVLVAEMRSKGTGMVKFSTESDARRAVDMLDRQTLEGSILLASLL